MWEQSNSSEIFYDAVRRKIFEFDMFAYNEVNFEFYEKILKICYFTKYKNHHILHYMLICFSHTTMKKNCAKKQILSKMVAIHCWTRFHLWQNRIFSAQFLFTLSHPDTKFKYTLSVFAQVICFHFYGRFLIQYACMCLTR